MHVLFLTENFPPEVNAPAVRTLAHCREWVKAGHEVTVITCAPNFPQGRVHPGYKNRLVSSEIVDGIRVIRVWSYISENKGFIRRVLDQLSYMVSASIGAIGVKAPDVVIGTSPQLFTGCAARLVAKLKGVPFIFEVRDLWPASIRAVGALSDGFVYRQLVKLESYLYKRADHIVTVTPPHKDHLIERGIGADRISVVTNGVDLDAFSPKPPDADLVRALDLSDRFVVGYIGTVGMAHGLETILEAAGDPALEQGDTRFHFVLVGCGARREQLMARAKQRGLANVTFVDPQPHAKVTDYYALLDAAIIHLRDTAVFRKVLPSKLFECMAMGVPILHGVRGPSADIVEANECGLVFEPESAEDFVRNLLEMAGDPARLAQMRSNGPQAAKFYDRRKLAKEMLAIVEGCVEPATQPQEIEHSPQTSHDHAPESRG